MPPPGGQREVVSGHVAPVHCGGNGNSGDVHSKVQELSRSDYGRLGIKQGLVRLYVQQSGKGPSGGRTGGHLRQATHQGKRNPVSAIPCPAAPPPLFPLSRRGRAARLDTVMTTGIFHAVRSEVFAGNGAATALPDETFDVPFPSVPRPSSRSQAGNMLAQCVRSGAEESHHDFIVTQAWGSVSPLPQMGGNADSQTFPTNTCWPE